MSQHQIEWLSPEDCLPRINSRVLVIPKGSYHVDSTLYQRSDTRDCLVFMTDGYDWEVEEVVWWAYVPLPEEVEQRRKEELQRIEDRERLDLEKQLQAVTERLEALRKSKRD